MLHTKLNKSGHARNQLGQTKFISFYGLQSVHNFPEILYTFLTIDSSECRCFMEVSAFSRIQNNRFHCTRNYTYNTYTCTVGYKKVLLYIVFIEISFLCINGKSMTNLLKQWSICFRQIHTLLKYAFHQIGGVCFVYTTKISCTSMVVAYGSVLIFKFSCNLNLKVLKFYHFPEIN